MKTIILMFVASLIYADFITVKEDATYVSGVQWRLPHVPVTMTEHHIYCTKNGSTQFPLVDYHWDGTYLTAAAWIASDKVNCLYQYHE